MLPNMLPSTPYLSDCAVPAGMIHDGSLYGEQSFNFDTYRISQDVSLPSGNGTNSNLYASPNSSPRRGHKKRGSSPRTMENVTPYTRRPKNAFILFRSHYYRAVRVQVLPDSPSTEDGSPASIKQNELSREAGLVWNAMSDEEKAPFRTEADRLKEEHNTLKASILPRPYEQVSRSPTPHPTPITIPTHPSVPTPAAWFDTHGSFTADYALCTAAPVDPNPYLGFSPLLEPLFPFSNVVQQPLAGGIDDAFAYGRTEPFFPAFPLFPWSFFDVPYPHLDGTPPNRYAIANDFPKHANNSPTENHSVGFAPGYIASEEPQRGFDGGSGLFAHQLFPAFDLVG